MEPYGKKAADKSKKLSSNAEEKQVEELLQAAQDEMLLKLSLNSHMSRVPPAYLDSDLHRRFQALKSRPSLPPSRSQSQPQRSVEAATTTSSTPPPSLGASAEDGESQALLGDELSVRFAALKGSLFSTSSSSTPTIVIPEDDEEEDEVEKLIRWAKDAARLDPSPPSDDEEDEDDDDDEDDNDEHENGHSRK
ncbi:hypothetical protein CJ030_MR5G003809 [Morella rubra]|uniref:Uncharacterized protein n=1 Tax=Morella rubra TaxID=262757 RepID=A0A6A1VIE7_9ROSI|nr:hypothetical protein CJ030_MR5G003807 [Morella rubra]KAB1212455.1 hypothetical protein CJ030_MR5G003809 [Morella rubra]